MMIMNNANNMINLNHKIISTLCQL